MKPELQTIFAYTFHTSGHLMDCADQLSDADYRWQPGYGHGSIHDILFHLLRAWNGWSGGLLTGARPQPLAAENYVAMYNMRAGYAREQSVWAEYINGLSEEQIAGEVHLVNRNGDKVTYVLWRLLQHMNFHAMQHHSEIAQLLTIKGQSPGNIDFLYYKD